MDQFLGNLNLWTACGNRTRLAPNYLAFFVGPEILPLLMRGALTDMLEAKLRRARKTPQCLVDRVSIANQFVSSALWYMLNLWTETMKQLEAFDKSIRDFVWSR